VSHCSTSEISSIVGILVAISSCWKEAPGFEADASGARYVQAGVEAMYEWVKLGGLAAGARNDWPSGEAICERDAQYRRNK